MKFLVLSLFVAAASAASFPSYTPYNTAKAFASVGPAQYVETVKVVPEPVVNKVRNVVTDGDASAVVLKADSEVNPDGYNYAYETSNGIAVASTGTLKKVDNVDTLVATGQYQFTLPNGEPFRLSYVADETGYHPDSDLLPKAHPVPVAIARALEYIAAHPHKEEVVIKKF